MPEYIMTREEADKLRELTGKEILDVENIRDHVDILDDVEAIIPPWRFKAEDLALLKNLKWIQTFSAGVNTLPLKEIKERGILLTNSSGVHGPQMTDHIMGMILSFSRALLPSIRNQKEKNWKVDYTLSELTGKEMLIVGAGSIGQLLAKKAKAFDMNVVGLKRTVEDLENFDEVRPLGELQRSMKTADYVVILAPLTKETRGLIGKEELALMKEDAVLINLARGPLVDEGELIKVLKEKKIRGAGLDVFSREPLPSDSPLWDLDNIILTPHLGGFSDVSNERSIELISENISRYYAGEKLKNIVNLELGY
ncbi:MAG TPA: D-2-hydroxyacid dehydrogenase [Proteiniclasticum sp.]|nr:D-2-hydroxyacid dehydrogenase [Proteiniclasticum sp.]